MSEQPKIYLWADRPLPGWEGHDLCILDRGGAIYEWLNPAADYTLKSSGVSGIAVAASVDDVTDESAYTYVDAIGLSAIKSGATKLGSLVAIPFVPHTGPTSSGAYSVDGAVPLWIPLNLPYPLKFISLTFGSKVATTNDSTHKWTGTVALVHTDDTATTIATFGTGSQAPDVYGTASLTAEELAVAGTIASDKAIILTIAKTSTPGNIVVGGILFAQFILA